MGVGGRSSENPRHERWKERRQMPSHDMSKPPSSHKEQIASTPAPTLPPPLLLLLPAIDDKDGDAAIMADALAEERVLCKCESAKLLFRATAAAAGRAVAVVEKDDDDDDEAGGARK